MNKHDHESVKFNQKQAMGLMEVDRNKALEIDDILVAISYSLIAISITLSEILKENND